MPKEFDVISPAKEKVLEWITSNLKGEELQFLAQGGVGFTKDAFLAVTSTQVLLCKPKKENLTVEKYELESYAGSKVSMGALQITFKDEEGKAKSLAIALNKASISEIQGLISTAHLNLSKSLVSQRSQSDQLPVGPDKGTYIGELIPESGIDFYERSSSKYGDRKISKLFQGGGKKIKVYSKALVCDGQIFMIDHQVSADIVFDGQTQVSRRPTLTRMGLLSPLPGSALIAGFALGKKETHDNREVHVVIAHPDWSLSIRVKPSHLGSAKALALRINAIADSLSPKDIKENLNEEPSQGDKLTKLKEIKSLLDDGFINEAEAEKMKKEVLEG